MNAINTFINYVSTGFTHVIPMGFDHILFILTLFFMNKSLRMVVIQCSVFTIAHSISLALSAANIILPDTAVIEPLIAVSILFTAIQNIVNDRVNKWRIVIVFLFGLIHGMGFANALKENGIPDDHFVTALVAFNIGVEIAQIAIVLLAYLLISKWYSEKTWYKQRIVYPISACIACIAFYWTIARIF